MKMRSHSNCPPGPAGTLSLLASGTFLCHCQGEDTRLSAQMGSSISFPSVYSPETSREANLRRAQDPIIGLKGPKRLGFRAPVSGISHLVQG